MKYNDVRQNTVGATRNFGIPGAYLDLTPYRKGTNKDQMRDVAGSFTVTIDPTKLYTLNESKFTATEVYLGIQDGSFPEGMEFMTPTGRARVMDGKLRYTRNKKIYTLTEIRV
jgi:hypothetical protein